ncbi:MAG: aldo/keto reductase [Deltaproteobacteria bacterium]|nr:aldo/keto reductase [Deltaproteobacteria bacterium]
MSDTDLSRRELITLSATAGASLALGTLLPEEALAKKKVPQVPRRVLGKTKKKVPILLMGGSMNFDPVFDVRLAEAYRYGVNYIDTADCYAGGRSEVAVGNFHTRAKIREKLWITSKSDDHDPEGFARIFAKSLEKLRTSYIDLYFLHKLINPMFLTPALEKRVAKLKAAGKLRFFGFSCHGGNVAELLTHASKLPWIDAVMFRYNFRTYGEKALNKAMDAAHKAGIGLIAMKTQGAAASFKGRWEPFHKKDNYTVHQAVLKAVWADPRITAAVSAMDSLKKLRENIAAALNRTKLSQRETDELERYAKATRSLACDGCDHLCGSHVDGPVRIGDTMRYLMYHDVYGDTQEARRRFAMMPARAQSLEGYDFSAASAACPHQVDLVWHMERASRVLRG